MKKIYNVILKILPIISIGLFILFWFVVSKGENSLIPSPLAVYQRFQRLLVKPIAKISIVGHIWASTKRVLSGLLFGCLFGIPFGLLIGWNRRFNNVFKPLFEIIRPIPALAWIPLLTLWLGIGERSKVCLVFISCFMPIVVNTYSGVRLIPKINLNVGRIYGANNKQLVTSIVIPSCLSAIMAGITTAMGTGWVVVLAAEMISANAGLGFLIIRGSDVSDLALVIFAMLLIGSLGALMSKLLKSIQKRLCPWESKLQN